MGIASCLYEGVVRHYRYEPVEHRFQYQVFLLFIDLDELPTLFDRQWVWSAGRPNLAWFRRSDHWGPAEQPLSDSIRVLVENRLGFCPDGPIRLLTHFRYFGFSMNPVSFYYCYDSQSTHVQAVVAEVNNTPWNERHCYVLDTRQEPSFDTEGCLHPARHPKQFHVSPFLEMDMQYAWRLSNPGERLDVDIENWTGRGKVFDARLLLKRTPLSSWNLSRVLIQYPLMTLKVFGAIYWQALRLWWKRIPYVPHPGVTLAPVEHTFRAHSDNDLNPLISKEHATRNEAHSTRP